MLKLNYGRKVTSRGNISPSGSHVPSCRIVAPLRTTENTNVTHACCLHNLTDQRQANQSNHKGKRYRYR